MTVTVWETNGGTLVLARGDEAWQAVAAWTTDDYREAAAAWTSGEWEPRESDGWQLVSHGWTADLDAEAERGHDLTRPAAVFAEAVQYARTLAAHEAATEALRRAVREAVEAGMSESEAARRSGVTRMTVRAWLGKP